MDEAGIPRSRRVNDLTEVELDTLRDKINIIDDEIHREMNKDIGIALMNVCGIK